MTIDEQTILSGPVFTVPQAEKDRMLVRKLAELTKWHRERCAMYARALNATGQVGSIHTPAGVPWLPVGLFKSHRLVSVPDADVYKTMTSSGTTGQEVSRILLDRDTADLQARALVRIMTDILGPDRLPMLIIDTPGVVKDRTQFAARGAGVLGMMQFGRHHGYALDDDMELHVDTVRAFLAKHGGAPFLMFGFTFMVWRYFVQRLAAEGVDLSNGILVHSGGWKKLQDEAVDNATFRAQLESLTGLRHVYNFYGMVEQVGSVFVEGEDGLLYPPSFADVIVRDPATWAEAAIGQPGVIQVVSILPRSYPGHSILTEDLGVVHSVDAGVGGRMGKAFSVIGRAPRAELRGCSDTHAFGSAAQ